jgi:hypothetical protein
MATNYKSSKSRKSQLNGSDELISAPVDIQHTPDVVSVINRAVAHPQVILSSNNVQHLQRVIGNKATQRLMRQPSLSPMIQRELKPIGGKSSGKGTGSRDKLNLMVETYLSKKENLRKNNPLGTLKDNQSLWEDLRNIRKYADDWYNRIGNGRLSGLFGKKMSKEDIDKKKAEISEWMRYVLQLEEHEIGSAIGSASLMDANDDEGLNQMKDLYETKKRDKKFTDMEYEQLNTWLYTPELVNIFRYEAKKEYALENIDAYLEVANYENNPQRDEAIRIYKKYDMGNTSSNSALNLDYSIAQKTKKMFDDLQNDKNAPAPSSFGNGLKEVLRINIADTFSRFRFTNTYKRITGIGKEKKEE